jgi:hypothetical protein
MATTAEQRATAAADLARRIAELRDAYADNDRAHHHLNSAWCEIDDFIGVLCSRGEITAEFADALHLEP